MNLSELLLQNTRSYLQLQKEYAQRKSDARAKYYTYVLMLQNGKFYVGNTDNIFLRLYQHYTMSAYSSVWVRTHGPVVRIVEILRNCSKDDEHYKTLQYCSLFGHQNVRGSWYCRVHPSFHLTASDRFVATRSDFHPLSRIEIDMIEHEVLALVQEFGNGPPTA